MFRISGLEFRVLGVGVAGKLVLALFEACYSLQLLPNSKRFFHLSTTP